MNTFLHKTVTLASGVNTPFTGEWISTALCRNGLIVTYTSGSNISTTFEGQSTFTNLPQGAPDSFMFFKKTGLNIGYTDPLFFDSPIPNIRIVATGAGEGKVWCYINYQN